MLEATFCREPGALPDLGAKAGDAGPPRVLGRARGEQGTIRPRRNPAWPRQEILVVEPEVMNCVQAS